jgi:hypothetical protein
MQPKYELLRKQRNHQSAKERTRHHTRMKKQTGDEISVADLKAAHSDQAIHLRQLNKRLMEENTKLHGALGRQKEYVEQVCGAIADQDPYPKYAYPKSQSKTSSLIVPALDLSDWHIGEVIRPDEVEGFNRYNWAIAQEGLFGIIEDFLKWVEVKRKWYRIEQCAIFCKGDYVSGDIHDELKVTNEFPLPVQTANAGSLMGEAFKIVSSHFGNVMAIECGADNHGRLQKKPQAKQKASNSMSYLVHHIANAAAAKCNNFHPVMTEGMKICHAVNGKKFLVEHGDTIKSHMGFPWYSLARSIGREALRRMNTSKGFDFYSIAHFHTPNLIEGKTIVNGSLSGTTEFDHSCGRHAKPCQVAFLIHPQHGIFDFTPFVRRDC